MEGEGGRGVHDVHDHNALPRVTKQDRGRLSLCPPLGGFWIMQEKGCLR
jgi:hypothetical protein